VQQGGKKSCSFSYRGSVDKLANDPPEHRLSETNSTIIQNLFLVSLIYLQTSSYHVRSNFDSYFSVQKNEITEPNLTINKEQFHMSQGNKSKKIRLWETNTVLLLAIPSKAAPQYELPDDQIVAEKVATIFKLKKVQMKINYCFSG
jgi:hypothetical protein